MKEGVEGTVRDFLLPTRVGDRERRLSFHVYLKFSPLLGEEEALDFSWSFRVKSTKEQESRTDAKCESK